MNVDEFVQVRVLPEYRDIVALIRQLMREMAPDIQESISYGVPAFTRKHIIAVISHTQKDITLSFSRGAEFEDRYGLLRGAGKLSKHVKIKSLDKIDLEALKYYIRQALTLDSPEK
jgi:hypothetical protein